MKTMILPLVLLVVVISTVTTSFLLVTQDVKLDVEPTPMPRVMCAGEFKIASNIRAWVATIPTGERILVTANDSNGSSTILLLPPLPKE